MRVPISRTENDPATFLALLRELERQPYRDPKGRFKPTPKSHDGACGPHPYASTSRSHAFCDICSLAEDDDRAQHGAPDAEGRA